MPMVTNQWGLRDKAMEFYASIPWASPMESTKTWKFLNKDWFSNKLKFSHLEHEKDKLNRQWTEIPFMWFDELTHFSKTQFFYLLSRNRSTCWVRPYVRATCNPDPDSWVKEFIERWIDQKTWYIIPERCWVLRYFTMDWENIVRWDSPKEVKKKCPKIFKNKELAKYDISDLIKSVTFIEWDIYENKKLLDKDPAYLGNLLAQSTQVKSQLFEWNRNVRVDGLSLFKETSLNDMFSNFVEDSEKRYITVDVARLWKDLAIIKCWQWFKVYKTRVFTKCLITDLYSEIEKLRKSESIQISRTLIDQDGVWWGLLDMWSYVWFSWWLPALPDPTTEIKENYANLKTQCFYRTAVRINDGSMAIDTKDIMVDGLVTKDIKVWWQIHDVKSLIKKQLRSIKKDKIDKEWKLQINSKENQKNNLNWMSPDFADTIMMREYFELIKEIDPTEQIFFS